MLRIWKAWLSGLPDVLRNLKFIFITGNLITILCLLNSAAFLSAVHRASDMIKKNVRTKFETAGTRLLDALCDSR